MMDDMTQMIKEKLLEDLISQMSEGHAGRLAPKGVGVEVQAPDKKALAEGLDKAKSIVGKADLAKGHGDMDSGSEEDDEHRLLELLEGEDDEEGH